MKVKNLLEKYVTILVITIISLAGVFLSYIVINAFYGKEAFGNYSIIYNVVLLFSSFIAFGGGQFLLREVSISQLLDYYLVKKLNFFLIITYSLSFISYILFLVLNNYNREVNIYLLISLPIAYLLGSINLLSNIKLANQRIATSTIINSSFHLILLISLALSIILNLNFLQFILLLSIVSASLTFLYQINIKKYFKMANYRTNNEVKSFKSLLKGLGPFGIIGITYYIYYQSDILLLSLMTNVETVAEYNAAFSILAALLILPKLLYQRLLSPYIYRKSKDLSVLNSKKYKFYNTLLVILSIIFYAILFFMSEIVIDLLFGEEYDTAYLILRIIGISFVLRVMYGMSDVILNFESNLNYKTSILIVTAISNILLNILLIPLLGIYGAALSTILCEIIILIMFQGRYKKYIRKV